MRRFISHQLWFGNSYSLDANSFKISITYFLYLWFLLNNKIDFTNVNAVAGLLLISSLISLAPKKIIIHLATENYNKKILSLCAIPKNEEKTLLIEPNAILHRWQT